MKDNAGRIGKSIRAAIAILAVLAWLLICSTFAIAQDDLSRASVSSVRLIDNSIELMRNGTFEEWMIYTWQLHFFASDPQVHAAILENLDHPDLIIRMNLIKELFLLGDHPADRIAALLEYVRNGNERERSIASSVLSKIEIRDHPEYIPMFIEAYKSGDLYMQWTAFRVLRDSVDAPGVLDAFLASIFDESFAGRWEVTRELGYAVGYYPGIFKDPRVVGVLHQLLQDNDESVQFSACIALRYHGQDPNSISALVDLFENDDSDRIRGEALRTLMHLGLSSQYESQIIQALRGPDGELKEAVVIGLSEMGGSPDLIPILFEVLLEDEGSFSARKGYEVLGKMDSEAAATVPFLIDIIESQSADSVYAVEALGVIGPAARDAVPTLDLVLAQPDQYIEERIVNWLINETIEAIGLIGGNRTSSLPRLFEYARQDDIPYQYGLRQRNVVAIEALGKLPELSEQIIPILLELREERSGTDREIAANLSLYRLDYQKQDTLSIILDGLFSTDDEIQGMSIWAAGEIGPPASEALPRLRELVIESHFHNWRGSAWESMSRIRNSPVYF